MKGSADMSLSFAGTLLMPNGYPMNQTCWPKVTPAVVNVPVGTIPNGCTAVSPVSNTAMSTSAEDG
jgi:hypothetical protein